MFAEATDIGIMDTLLKRLASKIYFHSGRTDSDFGHNDYKNGMRAPSYHWHHGESAHQHPCKYQGKSLIDLFISYNGTVFTNIMSEGEKYIFRAKIETEIGVQYFLLEINGTDDAFYLVEDGEKKQVEPFWGTNLKPKYITRKNSPWTGAIGGFDYLVNEEYFRALIKKHCGIEGSGDEYVTLEQMLQVEANELSWKQANIRDVLTWDATSYIPTYSSKRVINQKDIDAINACLKIYDITGSQIPHFIAQCSHECGCGNSGIEKYSGDNPITYYSNRDIWRENFDDIDLAATDSFWNNKDKIKEYSEKNNLNEKYKGYGAKYRGSGALQLTHYCEYKEYSEYTDDIEIIKQGAGPVAEKYYWDSAGWLWKEYYRMDEKFANGAEPSVEEITYKINGGYNGLDERKKFYDVCKVIFK